MERNISTMESMHPVGLMMEMHGISSKTALNIVAMEQMETEKNISTMESMHLVGLMMEVLGTSLKTDLNIVDMV